MREVLQVGHRPVGDEPAFVDEEDAIADGLDLREDVRREDDRVVRAEPADQVAHLCLLIRIETGPRLVEDEDVGLVHEGRGEAHALPVALRHRAEQPPPDGAEPRDFHGLVDRRPALGPAQPVE